MKKLAKSLNFCSSEYLMQFQHHNLNSVELLANAWANLEASMSILTVY